jgi:hypothetical protein
MKITAMIIFLLHLSYISFSSNKFIRESPIIFISNHYFSKFFMHIFFKEKSFFFDQPEILNETAEILPNIVQYMEKYK